VRGSLVLALATAACSGEDVPCLPSTNLGCPAALQCETVQGQGTPVCLPPLVVRGKAFDVTTHTFIAGARVVALGETGVPLAPMALTGADGAYEIRLHAPRDASLAPRSQKLTVAGQARGYGNFPDRWRAANPVDATAARPTEQKDQLVLATSDTNVPLVPFAGGPGVGVVSGHLPPPVPARLVIVDAWSAESLGGAVGVSGLVDSDGAYTLYGLPPGAFTLRAYARGANYLPAPLTLSAGEETSLDLRADATPTATVSGRLDVSGSVPTGVALYLASTWKGTAALGDQPVGLVTSAAADGTFAVGQVPAGRYVLVASPDNDGLALVGDAVVVEVGAGQDVSVPQVERVTQAVPIVSPGATLPEPVKGAPTISWQPVGSEASYHVAVTSSAGQVVWERDVARTDGALALPYSGPFVPGAPYRARVTALDARGAPLAASEDLRGIFYQPGP
jgi:hypothetical protein